MKDIKINSTSFAFLGFFPFEESMLERADLSNYFEPYDFYRKNQTYLDQKYYDNWVFSFFKKKHTHQKLRSNSDLFNDQFDYPYLDKTGVQFSIKAIDLFLFEAGFGIFQIKVDLPSQMLEWDTIIDFGSYFRNTTTNNLYPETPLSIQILEKYITTYFHSDSKLWRKYNPQLKSAIFMDVDESFERQQMDLQLFRLAAFTNPGHAKQWAKFSESYYKEQLGKNTIDIYDNWRAICLYDSMARIAVNMNEIDRHKIWENEYVLIYVYVIYARYFLHDSNNRLTELFEERKLIRSKRDEFFKFINEFNHTKVSYKFLPNLIYDKLKQALEIDSEVTAIEKKLNRVNVLGQERYERNVNGVLLFIALLTIVSVIHDVLSMMGILSTAAIMNYQF